MVSKLGLVCAVFCLILQFSAAAVAERTFYIGTSPWPVDYNFLGGNAQVSLIYRELTQSGLVLSRPSGQSLVGAKGVAFKSETELEVSIDVTQRFSNGSLLSSNDVVVALNSCPIFNAFGLTVKSVSKTKIVLTAPGDSAEPRKQMLEALESCPIDDVAVVSSMGPVYGFGTNVVGLGNYTPIEVRPGRLVAFRGGVREAVGPHSFERLEVKAVDSADGGLAALRLGNIEMLMTHDNVVLAEAARDTTLSTGRCGELNFVARSSVSVPCTNGQLKFSEVRDG